MIWRQPTTTPSGLGAASGQHYFLPLQAGGIYLLDVINPRASTHIQGPPGEAPGNLVFYSGTLWSQSATAVTAYKQLDKILERAEARVAEKVNDPAARLIWTTGLFFSTNRQRYLEQIHDPLLNQLTLATTGLPYDQVFTDPNGAPVDYDRRYPNDSYFLLTNAKDQQLAAYGEGTFSFTDQLKLTLGARFSESKYSFNSLTGGPQLFLAPQTVSADKNENSFTPKVSFSYQMDPRNLFYFTYAKGFRPGGGNNPVPQAACASDFANLGIAGAPATFSSDTVNSFEVGAKNNFDNRVKIASSVYYIRWNNIQQTVIPPICQISFISNLGTAVAKGLDLQAEIAVTAGCGI